MSETTLLREITKRAERMADKGHAALPRNLVLPIGKDVVTYADPGARLLADDTNPTTRFARFIVSTDDVDREGDVVEPRGCLKYLQDFLNNPIWYFDHSYRNAAHGAPPAFPIGTGHPLDATGRPTGAVDIDIAQNQIKAGCYFDDGAGDTQAAEIARDTWRLVHAGILRGASIGFIPVQAEKRGKDSYHFFEWRLTEISVTGLPANQRSLRVASLTGEPLESYQRLKSWSPGVTVDEEETAVAIKQPVEAPVQPSRVTVAKKVYPTKAKAAAWLKAAGYDADLKVATATPAEWIFPQSKRLKAKTLAKGIKSFPPDDEEDEDEEGEDDADAAAKTTDDDDSDDSETEASADTETETSDAAAIVPHEVADLARLHDHHEGVKAFADDAAKLHGPEMGEHWAAESEHAEGRMGAIKELVASRYPDVDFDKARDTVRQQDTAAKAMAADAPADADDPDQVAKRLKAKRVKAGRTKSDGDMDAAEQPTASLSKRLCKDCRPLITACMKDLMGDDEAETKDADSPVITTDDVPPAKKKDDQDSIDPDGPEAKSLLAKFAFI